MFAVPHCGTSFFACVSSHPKQPSCRLFSTSLAKVPSGHALPTGPLSPLLNIDLRAELRFDVRRWVSLFANPPNITLRRRLATGLARLTSLFKRNSASCLMLNSRGRPALATASHGLPASMPTDTRARNRCRKKGCTGTVTYGSTIQTSAFTLRTSIAAASSPPLVLRLRGPGLANRSV